MANGYSLGRYLKERAFVSAVQRAVQEKGVEIDDKFKHIETKRDLLGMLYNGLKGRGGETVTLKSCKRERIGSAFKNLYHQAEKNMQAYEQAIAKEQERLEEAPVQLELFPQPRGCGCMFPDGV